VRIEKQLCRGQWYPRTGAAVGSISIVSLAGFDFCFILRDINQVIFPPPNQLLHQHSSYIIEAESPTDEQTPNAEKLV